MISDAGLLPVSGPDPTTTEACKVPGIQCYGDGKKPGGDGGGLGSILPMLFLALIMYCMVKFFRRAQGYNSRNGSGGWGGRGDPEQEGIGLVDTCLPTSSMRARNLVNDMQVRHKLWSCAVPQILPASS